MNEHERGFLEFLEERSRRRIATLLEFGERRRGAVRELLDHDIALKPDCREFVGGTGASLVEAELLRKGAPAQCRILSANLLLDAREMPLTEALRAVIGMGHGTFISCIAGRLGVFEYEDVKSTYLLSR